MKSVAPPFLKVRVKEHLSPDQGDPLTALLKCHHHHEHTLVDILPLDVVGSKYWLV